MACHHARRLALGLALLLAAPPLALAQPATDAAATRYPIVLIHGFLGFDTLLGMDYWFGIPGPLREAGAKVFVPQVAAIDSNEARGEQLLRQLEQYRAQSGAEKFNLIGHSQGGMTARYVAVQRPEWVASITTVGSPHKGSAFADWLRARFAEGSVGERLAVRAFALTGRLIDLGSRGGYAQQPLAALDSMTSTGAADFNARHPAGIPTADCGEGEYEVDGIRFWSWGSIGHFSTGIDPSDGALWLTGLPFEEENDGLVGRCSTHFGEVLRDDYPHNHMDQTNLLFGLDGGGEDEPVALYLAHAARLKAAGL